MNDRETLKALSAIDFWTSLNRPALKDMVERLHNCEEAQTGELVGIYAAALACQQSVERVAEQFKAYDNASLGRFRQPPEELSEDDLGRLLKLNRLLKKVGDHICEVAKDIKVRMEAKVADPADPMVDYELDAHLDYVLREDDPAYLDDADNILTSRRHGVKNLDLFEMEWPAYAPLPAQNEPHCALFHDLYEHRDYFGGEGRARPWRPFKDCLRIGSVWVDVKVWQQYEYEVSDEPGT